MKARRELRVGGAVYFGLAGLALVLALSLGTPSFWYWVCGVLFTLTAVAWTWRPDIAAGLAVGPLAGLLFLFQYTGPTKRSWYLAAILVPGMALVVWEYFRASSRRIVPIVISVGLVVLAFVVDRRFTNQAAVKVLNMGFALDGQAPWGQVGPLSESGQPLVVLYIRAGDSYCYDAVYSAELRNRLRESESRSVRVEYNTVSDFGRERGYNLRSVAGLRFNDESHVSQDPAGFGGQALGTGKPVDCPR
jgi:hypothetical protein